MMCPLVLQQGKVHRCWLRYHNGLNEPTHSAYPHSKYLFQRERICEPPFCKLASFRQKRFCPNIRYP